ncbi:MAG: hypothetical protein HYT76_00320 [Deltaproteobacteria bacterium]|nr:hypothetical protein [Deltaproteobacteria bacterium]
MLKKTFILFSFFLSLLFLGGNLLAENKGNLSYGAETNFASRYVWVGIPLSDGPVLQPSAWVSLNKVTLRTRGNLVLIEETNEGQFNEVDFFLDSTHEWRQISFNPWLGFFFFPNQDVSPTSFAGLTVSYPISIIRIFTSHVADLIAHPGMYFGEVGISYDRNWGSQLSFKSSTSIGWGSPLFNEVMVGPSRSALNAHLVAASLTWKPQKYLFVRPYAGLSVILDSGLRRELDDPTILLGGLAMGVEL